jgi:N-glycosylase/DNA lyase
MVSKLDLKKSYENKKNKIKERLLDFKNVWNKSDEEIFAELSFCLLTPQTKARSADMAIKYMVKTGILFSGNENQFYRVLKSYNIRFPENKAKYIVMARELFKKNGNFEIKSQLQNRSDFDKRDWLVNNVMGFGLKEASHFLRNIGLGFDLAILDRHIIKNLLRYGVINEIPKTLTKKQYLMIEERMKDFSKKIGIPLAELDLLFWSEETGEIFK